MPTAVPHTARPREKVTIEASNGTSGPRRSHHMPAATMPTTPLAKGAAKESA